MKKLFTDSREPRLETDALQHIEFSLEVDETQKGQTKGIVATVLVKNHNDDEVAVLNPFETMQFLLVDTEGAPVDLPKKAPNLLINRKGKNWEWDVVFPVIGYFENGREVDASKIKNEILTLPGNGSLTAQFSINRMIDSGEETPIPSGKYAIQALTPLINADNRSESRALESPRITVEYSK